MRALLRRRNFIFCEHIARSQAGFTIVELLAALFLLALAASLAIPQLGQITDANVKSQARQIGGAVEYASTQAVARRRIYRLYFDINEGRYWLATQRKNGSYRPLKQDLLGRPHALMDGVLFESVFAVDTLYQKGVTYAEFLPDGTVDPLLVHLQTDEDDPSHYTVEVDEFTASSEILDEYLDPKNYSKTKPKVAR